MNSNLLHPIAWNTQKQNQKQKLFYLYTYYCSFADRENYERLKIQNFRRMLLDAQIISNHDQMMMREVQILFSQARNKYSVSEDKNNRGFLSNKGRNIKSKNVQANWIQFQTFLDLLPRVQTLINSHNEQFQLQISQNLNQLCTYIQKSTQFGNTIKNLSINYHSQNCFIILQSLSPTLFLIYTQYFDLSTMKAIQKQQQTFNKLSQFCKNFQIVPQIVTKSQIFVIFRYVLQSDQQAQSVYKQWFQQDNNININNNLKNKKNIHRFKYFHFVVFLLFISLKVNKKIQGYQQLSQLQKLVIFLEMLQVSTGFVKLCKKQQVNMHLLPKQKLIKQLQSDQQNHGKQQQQSSFASFSPNNNHPHFINSQQSSHRHEIVSTSCQKLTKQLHPKSLQYYGDLHKKFISFCLHAQTIGTSCLSHKKSINVIKKLELGLKQSQIQVYLAAYAKGNQAGLQFQQFLDLLQKISQKQMIQLEDLIAKVIKIKVIQQQQSQRLKYSRRNVGTLSRKQYRNCVAMIQIIQPILYCIFEQQCIPNTSKTSANITPSTNTLSFISLSSYIKIMYILQLSPLYLTKQSLIQIFSQSIKKSYDFMNFMQFKDSFIIALPYYTIVTPRQPNKNIPKTKRNNNNTSTNQIYEDNNNDDQQLMQPQTKMIIVIERINQSRGVNKIQRQQGYNKANRQCISKIRQLFMDYYPKSLDGLDKNKVIGTNRNMNQMSYNDYKFIQQYSSNRKVMTQRKNN